MAGAVCDGIHIHPFHSPQYVTDVQVPNLVEGAAADEGASHAPPSRSGWTGTRAQCACMGGGRSQIVTEFISV